MAFPFYAAGYWMKENYEPLKDLWKRYADRFAIYGRKVVKVGISFDVGRHTICDWKIMAE